jgi:hypothetical protein
MSFPRKLEFSSFLQRNLRNLRLKTWCLSALVAKKANHQATFLISACAVLADESSRLRLRRLMVLAIGSIGIVPAAISSACSAEGF